MEQGLGLGRRTREEFYLAHVVAGGYELLVVAAVYAVDVRAVHRLAPHPDGRPGDDAVAGRPLHVAEGRGLADGTAHRGVPEDEFVFRRV